MVAVAMQAVARAGVAGGGARLGVLVRAREAEFWAPNASRKSFRQLLARMLLAALTGWQTGNLVVCSAR